MLDMLVDDEAAPYYNDNSAARHDEAATASRAAPQGKAAPAAVQFDRSEAGMVRLQQALLKMEIPFVEDAPGQAFGEATWKNADKMVNDIVGHGYTLQRRNKQKVHAVKDDANRMRKNRWRTVLFVCAQAGTPDKRGLTGSADAPAKKSKKNTTSKKLDCKFQVTCNWAGAAGVPTISTASLCLHHYIGSEKGLEHEAPKTLDNQMTDEAIEAHEELIRLLHFQRVDTKTIHKTLQGEERRLGEKGKQLVRTMRVRVDKERTADLGGANDAQQLLTKLQLEGCWMRFKLDKAGRVKLIAWATDEQRKNALRYHMVSIQDNTINTNQYKYFLALIVVVDKENFTQIAMQALLSNERTEDFVFLFRTFRELIGGAQQQVIFTDADAAAMAAVQQECPSSRHQLCLFHMDDNLRKHGKGLGEGVLAAVIGTFHKAAYAQTEDMFLQHKQDLFKLLRPDSHMYTYMADTVFAPKLIHRWATHGHPGLPTLGMASTQRVESANSALKPVMSRSGTMLDVHRAIVGKVQDDANKTTSQNTGGVVQRVRLPTPSSFETVKASWLGQFDFVRDGMRQAGCSAFAMKDMSDEALAAMGYKPETLATGNDNVQRLLAELVAKPAGAGLLYDATSGRVDGTLATRTSMKFFAELLGDEVLDQLVRVTNMYGAETQYCHLVALGPDGFFLCTCLRILIEGLCCRHALRAMHNADLGFTGACIGPRWRDGTMPWTVGRLAAKPAVLSTTGTGVPGEVPLPPADASAFCHAKATVRASGWASCCAFGKQLATITAGIENIPAISRVLENLENQARQLVEVELRSQHDASTSQVFKGVVTWRTTAPEPPEGGGGGTRPSEGSGTGQGGGAGGRTDVAGAPQQARGVGGGRDRSASDRSGGRGGAGAGVSAAGMPSPGMGLSVSAITGEGGGASPFGQALGSLGSTAFDSSAPESFQQSKLNGCLLHSDNDSQAFLEDVLPPETQKQTGQSKRRTSIKQRDKRRGGQHVVRGGAAGAWGGGPF